VLYNLFCFGCLNDKDCYWYDHDLNVSYLAMKCVLQGSHSFCA